MTLTTLITIMVILTIHWFADFVCQTSYQAENKSKSFDALLGHTLIYSLIWFGATIIYGIRFHAEPSIMWFAPITFICHTATDYYTSRANAMLWERKETHNFFASIGFDQLLHYAQLFITYKLLF